MFNTPSSFWVKDSEAFTADARDGFHPRFGCRLAPPAYGEDVARLGFSYSKKVGYIGGATGAGKSAVVNTLMYNAISEYSPESLAIIYGSMRGLDGQMWDSKKFPHIIHSYIGRPGKSVNEVDMHIFFSYVWSYLERIDDKLLFIVIDDVDFAADKQLGDLYNTIESVKQKYNARLLMATQAPNAEQLDLIRSAEIRLALRCSSKISEAIIDSPCASYIKDVFGMGVYYDTIDKERSIYHLPFVPDWRIDEDSFERAYNKGAAGTQHAMSLEHLVKNRRAHDA